MSPDPDGRGSVRSVAVINEEIRALWAGAAGSLTRQERARYSELLAEYAAAVQARTVTAA